MMEKLISMILDLCKNQDRDWEKHIKSVVKYSKLLAKQLNADEEICEISAWLHDIKKLRGEYKKHHIYGAEEAEQILKKLNYPKNKIKEIKHCILAHTLSKYYPIKSKEARIVASADALSNFDDFIGLIHRTCNKEYSIEENRGLILKKYEWCWEKIMPEARSLAKSKYDAIKLLLK